MLAFIIEEFYYIEINKFCFSIKLLANFDKNIDHKQFLLELVAKTLFFYKELFNSKYPLSKMNMIFISNFNIRAIEN